MFSLLDSKFRKYWIQSSVAPYRLGLIWFWHQVGKSYRFRLGAIVRAGESSPPFDLIKITCDCTWRRLLLALISYSIVMTSQFQIILNTSYLNHCNHFLALVAKVVVDVSVNINQRNVDNRTRMFRLLFNRFDKLSPAGTISRLVNLRRYSLLV